MSTDSCAVMIYPGKPDKDAVSNTNVKRMYSTKCLTNQLLWYLIPGKTIHRSRKTVSQFPQGTHFSHRLFNLVKPKPRLTCDKFLTSSNNLATNKMRHEEGFCRGTYSLPIRMRNFSKAFKVKSPENYDVIFVISVIA